MINLDTSYVDIDKMLVPKKILYKLTPVAQLILNIHKMSAVGGFWAQERGLLDVNLARAWVRNSLRLLNLLSNCGYYGVVTLWLIPCLKRCTLVEF